MLSFVLSALGCACAGLCYAEMAAMIPVAGSAYTYAFATLGELVAWLIGWALVLEYAVGAITVAISWSGYFVEFMRGFGVELPKALCNGYFATWVDAAGVTQHGLINLPAIVLVAAITVLLIVGVKESARATSIIVLQSCRGLGLLGAGRRLREAEQLAALYALWLEQGHRGRGRHLLRLHRLRRGDDDVGRSQRSEAGSAARHLGLAGGLHRAVHPGVRVLTGIVPYTQLNVPAPRGAGAALGGGELGAFLVSFGALAGLGSVVLVMMMGQPRVFMAMSRDGLLPSAISKVHPRFHTPYRSTMLTGIVVALASSTLNVEIAGELTSMGTLFAFVVVCVGVVVLRRSHPDAVRPSARQPQSLSGRSARSPAWS